MRKRLLIALASLPLWILLGEGGVRLALYLKGEPYSARETWQRLSDVKDGLQPVPGMERGTAGTLEAGGAVTGIHPYVGWDVVSDQVQRELLRFRGRPAGAALDVLVVGGSVGSLTSSRGGPAILAALREVPALRARKPAILNHGRGSFKQPQLTLKVAYLLSLGYKPDAVVLIDGFNEVALGADNYSMGVHPLHPHWNYYGPSAGMRARTRDQLRRYGEVLAIEDALIAEVDRAERWHLTHSAILGRWASTRVAALRAEWAERQDSIVESSGGDAAGRDPARGPEFPGGAEEALHVIVDSWVEGSIQLNAICKAHDIPFLHVLQPTLYDTGSKPLTEQELAAAKIKPSWKRGVEKGYPLLRAAVPRIVEAGVPFLDGSDTFAELTESTYYDACHFRGTGMNMFAQRIGEALVPLLR